jgi:hypothetical protein
MKGEIFKKLIPNIREKERERDMYIHIYIEREREREIERLTRDRIST